MRVPGGGASCLGVGRPDWALSHSRPPVLWAWARGPVTNPTARALASWLCALGGRLEGAQGGCLLPGCGVSGVGRSPTPDCPSLGRAAGARFPLAVPAVCRPWGPAVSARRRVLCPLPGFAASGAVAAGNLSLCRGCRQRRASLACLVAPLWCAAPRPVRSLSVLRSAFRSPLCLPPARGLSLPTLLGGCAGHVEAG